jgi:hypothetical protein
VIHRVALLVAVIVFTVRIANAAPSTQPVEVTEDGELAFTLPGRFFVEPTTDYSRMYRGIDFKEVFASRDPRVGEQLMVSATARDPAKYRSLEDFVEQKRANLAKQQLKSGPSVRPLGAVDGMNTIQMRHVQPDPAVAGFLAMVQTYIETPGAYMNVAWMGPENRLGQVEAELAEVIRGVHQATPAERRARAERPPAPSPRERREQLQREARARENADIEGADTFMTPNRLAKITLRKIWKLNTTAEPIRDGIMLDNSMTELSVIIATTPGRGDEDLTAGANHMRRGFLDRYFGAKATQPVEVRFGQRSGMQWEGDYMYRGEEWAWHCTVFRVRGGLCIATVAGPLEKFKKHREQVEPLLEAIEDGPGEKPAGK